MNDESHNLRQRPTRQRTPSDPLEDERAPTVRTTPIDADPDALPEQASLYVAPQPAPRISEHKTIDMVPVRLSPEVDPRRALTQRLDSLPAPPHRRGRWLAASLLLVVLLIAGVGMARWLSRGPGQSPALEASAPLPPEPSAVVAPVVEPASAAAAMASPVLTPPLPPPAAPEQKAAPRSPSPLKSPAPRPAARSPEAAPKPETKPASEPPPKPSTKSTAKSGRDLWIE